MKTKRFRLLTVLLTAVMMFALSVQVYAATSNPVTQDGLTATLVTDKDSYQAGESINATVQVDNNTGKQVFIWTQITVPSAVKLAGESAFDAVLANGESWTSAAGIVADGTAGSTATGDNLQAGLWSVLSLLALGGVAALLVYGKNRKTWVSIMLCVVMIGGMMAAAVPAQAAGVTGSMSLSCPIRLDGQTAEVTAIVNYIIGYEADSAATTTPGEDATAAPTEAPTAAPTETPTEAPTAAPTEAPDETDTPDEAGYYVVWDDFVYPSANGYSTQNYSSWDVSNATSIPATLNGGAMYADNSKYADAHMQRAFNAITDDFVWEFTVKADSELEGTTIDMRYQDTTAIRFLMKDSKLEVVTAEGNTAVCDISTDRFAILKVEVSPANGTYTVIADGKTVAEDLSFLNTCTALDRMYIQTTEEATGSITLSTVRVYVGYYVNEKFLNADNGTISDEWTVTGDAAAIYKQGTQGPDDYSVILKDGASVSRAATYEQDGAWVEYQHLMEENVGEFAMILSDDAGNAFKVATVDGKFGYYEGETFKELYDCLSNMWYHVMLKQTDEGTELYLNHKLKVEGLTLPFEKFTNITFTAEGGEALLDDIVVKDWIPYPEDYVPEPVPVEKDEDDILVGLQSCNLWVEGHHFGYDWLTQWDERTPYLGYYDETSAETADWELKWKIEHGIDYELFCWFRNQGGVDEPIKSNRNGVALHEGYFNARYSDQMKFAITWECKGGRVSGSEDFRENVVPYWIEQYFKDDRYLLIDNKPVVGMYSVANLMSYFGNSAAGVAAEFEYLEQACIEAGFDGCYIMMANSDGDNVNVQAVSDAGFDGMFAYSWGWNNYNIEMQKSEMLSFSDKLAAAGNTSNIAVASMGWDARAWDRGGGGYCTIEDYTELLQWIKDEYIPTQDEDSLGAKTIILDNWNEFGEGHFLMPSNLYGFGYVDAVREVFGDGTEHTDVVPTENQLARINHMYIQDREVEMVDMETADDLDVLQGFYFEEDLEGWTVAKWKGEDMDVENLRQEDGALKGNTHEGDASYADPAILAPAVELDAKEAQQIRVRMKASVKTDVPQLYFTTDSEGSFSQAKCVTATYAQVLAGEDGYTEVIFDMSSNAKWAGTVTQLRFDPLAVAGSFEIDSFEILGRTNTGDATIYLDGEKVYNDIPIKLVNGTVMFPVEELDTLLTAKWTERLDGSAVEVFARNVDFYRFPYASNTVVANGETVDLTQGACIIDDEIYIPIAYLFESQGYIVEWNETDKVLSVSKDTSDDPYEVVKAWYFTSGTEGWVNGGAANKCDWYDGTLHATAGNDTVKVWSPADINVPTEEVSHIRIRLKSNVEEPILAVSLLLNGKEVRYNTSECYVEGEDTYAEVIIDLRTTSEWQNADVLSRICVFPFSGNIGSEAWIDSVELVYADLPIEGGEEEDTDKVVAGYYFEEGKDGFYNGGSTSVTQADGALVVTTSTAGHSRTWSPAFNAAAADVSHIRMMVKNSVEGKDLVMYARIIDAAGTAKLVTYTVPMPVSADEYAEVLINLTEAEGWSEAVTLKELGIYCLGAAADTSLAGTVVYFDSVEVLKMSEAEEENPYQAIKAFYFTDSLESWVCGGGGSLTYKAGGYMNLTNMNAKTRIWSPGDYLGINLEELEVIRMLVQTTVAVENPSFDMEIYSNMDKLTLSHTFTDVSVVPGEDGWAEILLDCTEIDWGDATTLDRLAILPFNAASTEVFTVDSIEFLKTGSGETETPEETDPNGGDDGVNEVAGAEYDVLFGSYYFKDSTESWVPGGSTALSYSDGAMKVTAAADGQPRFWTSDQTQGVTNTALDLAADEVTHIRIRVKTAVEGQKMAVFAEFADAEQNTTMVQCTDVAYTAQEDGYTEVLIKLSDYATLKEGDVLQRVGIYPFGTTNNAELAGKTVYIGSVEFLKAAEEETVKVLVIGNSITQHTPNANLGWLANWGMAATSRDNDYVHLLQAKALEKNAYVQLHGVNIAEYEKYFYDWSQIVLDYGRYAEFDPDIIICTIGANVKNGANEGDSSYENDKTFTKELYKAIIDYFNPGNDAKIIVGTTPLTNVSIDAIIYDATAAYGYDYVDMTDLSGDQYKATGYEATLKEQFGVTSINSGVLNHPGDEGMAAMADRLWEKLDPLLASASDSEGGSGEGGTEEGGSGDGGSEEGGADESTETVVAGYYFESGKDGFYNGGSTGVSQADDALVVTTSTAGHSRIWSPAFNAAAEDVSHIRMKVKNSVEGKDLVMYARIIDATGTAKLVTYTTPMPVSADDYTEVLIDLTAAEGWTEAVTLKELGIYCLGAAADTSLAGTVVYFDSIEVLKVSEASEGGSEGEGETGEEGGTTEPTYTVLKAFTFDSGLESWGCGGGGSLTANAAGYANITNMNKNSKMWSPADPYMAVSLADMTHIRMMVKTSVTENASFDMVLYTNNNGSLAVLATLTDVKVEATGTDWVEVLIDCSEMDWGSYTTLDRLYIAPYNETGTSEVFMMDSLEVLKVVEG